MNAADTVRYGDLPASWKKANTSHVCIVMTLHTDETAAAAAATAGVGVGRWRSLRCPTNDSLGSSSAANRFGRQGSISFGQWFSIKFPTQQQGWGVGREEEGGGRDPVSCTPSSLSLSSLTAIPDLACLLAQPFAAALAATRLEAEQAKSPITFPTGGP